MDNFSRMLRAVLYNKSMDFTLLTYNVLYNEAFPGLKEIIGTFRPDILCLQEVDTSENNLQAIERYGYTLADYSNSFIKFHRIFGVATFYYKNKLVFSGSSIVQLPRNIYEIISLIIRVLRGQDIPRTVLHTEFELKQGKQKIVIYNTHLAVFETNGARVRQLKKILDFADTHKKLPLCITGDLNYAPYRRKRLEKLMQKHGLREATASIPYTFQATRDGNFERFNFLQKIMVLVGRIFHTDKLKVDYMFYKNLRLKKIQRIEVHFSDHFPILAHFKI